jgi:hypothetical protein
MKGTQELLCFIVPNPAHSPRKWLSQTASTTFRTSHGRSSDNSGSAQENIGRQQDSPSERQDCPNAVRSVSARICVNVGLRTYALKHPAMGLLNNLHKVWVGGFTHALLQDPKPFDAQSARCHGALHLYENPQKLEHLNQGRFHVNSHLQALVARPVFRTA